MKRPGEGWGDSAVLGAGLVRGSLWPELFTEGPHAQLVSRRLTGQPCSVSHSAPSCWKAQAGGTGQKCPGASWEQTS